MCIFILMSCIIVILLHTTNLVLYIMVFALNHTYVFVYVLHINLILTMHKCKKYSAIQFFTLRCPGVFDII